MQTNSIYIATSTNPIGIEVNSNNIATSTNTFNPQTNSFYTYKLLHMFNMRN